jgi:hypothetical protein
MLVILCHSEPSRNTSIGISQRTITDLSTTLDMRRKQMVGVRRARLMESLSANRSDFLTNSERLAPGIV